MNKIVICGNEQQIQKIKRRMRSCDAELYETDFCKDNTMRTGSLYIALTLNKNKHLLYQV